MRRCRAKAPAALILGAIACLIAASLPRSWWNQDGSSFSLLAPKSYRGLHPTSSHHHNTISWSMVIHDASIVMIFATVGYAAAYSQQRLLCVPHAVEEWAPGPPSPQSGALLAAGLYGANIAYNVVNKRLLLAHPHPCLVTGMNLFSSAGCCVLCWGLGLMRWPGRLESSVYLRLLGLAVFHWGGMLFSNISVAEVHISFTHTVKAAEPFFTALFTVALLGKKPTIRAWLSLLLVIAGIVVASTAETSFTWVGFWAAMASNVMVSLRTVLSKRLIESHILDPLNFQALLQCGAALVSVPVALCFNLHAVKEIALDPSAVSSAIMIGPLVWIFNVASIVVLVHSSPVVHAMIRSMRRPLLVLASIITFGTCLTWLNAMGIAVTILGALWFRYENEVKLERKPSTGNLKRLHANARHRAIP
ncbi:unnamed protein product [Effrenium voratum]|uniref:Sugar phosphate transporter domain-containing protein n=1 Tax=Effrenium voratum TaxID=2562239 RepID=A0AA36I233_9DINO|nr:unnamed protein product [Effrenium voratum]CAJ1379297.1 unnamed protein product [Effrenium voratum]CAJ1434128.1 unnamed protein product [Effrenium voratum]CAJ1444004.1 unnamed protein product [Effrenium voratum]|mmetsp:Transcript_105118/g.250252  ORF Transcript_105118/g.250252 Transcript_105118/m.250252 type:complete len:419 (+) Transcript_105118:43-1299(+)